MHVHLSEGVFGSDGVLRVELRSRLLVVTQAQYIALSYLTPLWPSILVFLTVVAFTLVGEGIRNALDRGRADADGSSCRCTRA